MDYYGNRGVWHNRWHNRNRESIDRLMQFKHADTPAYEQKTLEVNDLDVVDVLMKNSVERVENEKTFELLTEMIYRIEVLEEQCDQLQQLIEQH